jgi:hypothetical protein
VKQMGVLTVEVLLHGLSSDLSALWAARQVGLGLISLLACFLRLTRLHH